MVTPQLKTTKHGEVVNGCIYGVRYKQQLHCSGSVDKLRFSASLLFAASGGKLKVAGLIPSNFDSSRTFRYHSYL